MGRPRVFVSYSHHDDPVLESLLPYLATLEREELASVWSDRRIKGGERWHAEIEAALDAASIAVVLISQEFLASPFIRDDELPRILQRQQEGRLTVLPVFVSPSTVTSQAFIIRDSQGGEQRILLSEFQGFGTPDRTLSELEPTVRQRRFVELHNRIRELATGERDATTQLPVVQVALDPQRKEKQRPHISHIPFLRNRTFTGREEYLLHLHNELRSGKPAAVTQALAGLGGIGKTQLALEYSYRYGHEYDVLWWIRAENRDTRLDDLRTLGHALGVDQGIDPSLVVDATLQWLDRRGDWLLVFDNAEHPNDIRDLFPKSGRGRILITSRHAAWGAVAKTVSLGLWSAEEAAGYLSRRTGLDIGPAAAAVAETLGYLPLALAQAAAYIEETGTGFDGYLQLLKARPAETLKLRATSTDAEKAVATVWDIAFDRVAASSPAAVELLNLFSFLPPDRIPRRLLVERVDRLPPLLRRTVEDTLALDAAVGALRRYSLVDTLPDAFSVHRLVQAVVRGRLDNDTYRLLSETAKDLETEPSAPASEEPREPPARRRRTYALWTIILLLPIIGATAVQLMSTLPRIPPVTVDPKRNNERQVSDDAIPEWQREVERGRMGLEDAVPMTEVPANNPLRRVAGAVGQVRKITADGATAWCTAFVVDNQTILTAGYCVRDTTGASMTFVVAPDGRPVTYSLDLPPKKLMSEKSLDYALVSVKGGPQLQNVLRLSSRPPLPDEPLAMVLFRNNDEQLVSVDELCRVGKIEENRISHGCDTGRGSSGAPLLSADGKVVYGIHYSKLHLVAGYALRADRILADITPLLQR